MAKVSVGRVGHKLTGMIEGTGAWVAGYDWLFVGEKQYPSDSG